MAIINLPGGSQWNDELTYEEQTDETKQYLESQIHRVPDGRADRADGRVDWFSFLINSNLQIVVTFGYLYPIGNPKAYIRTIQSINLQLI